MSCYRHIHVSARFRCPGCKATWCPECVERPEYEHATASICPNCKGLLRACAPTQTPSEPHDHDAFVYEEEGSFPGDLGRAFLFPLRPRVLLTMLAFCVVFFFWPDYMRGYHLTALWLILVIAIFGLMGNYLGDIIVSLALGDEELPRVQMFENFVVDGMLAGCRYLFLLALCFGVIPFFARHGWPLRGLLVGLCTSFFFPIMWLGAALTRSLGGCFQPALFRAWRAISVPYIVTYLCMVLGLGLCDGLLSMLYVRGGSAYLIVFPLAGYFLFVMSFMLGKLVYHHREEFEDAGLI